MKSLRILMVYCAIPRTFITHNYYQNVVCIPTYLHFNPDFIGTSIVGVSNRITSQLNKEYRIVFVGSIECCHREMVHCTLGAGTGSTVRLFIRTSIAIVVILRIYELEIDLIVGVVTNVPSWWSLSANEYVRPLNII